MDLGVLVLLLVGATLTVFTIGASVAWRLEGRRPLVPPLWLVVARGLSSLVWALYILVALDAPSGIAAIDPFWWTLLKALPSAAAVFVLVVEVRQALGRRQAT